MTEPAPILLIGAARSGTKFLRSLLAAGAGVKAVPYDVNYVWRYGHEDAPDDRLDPAEMTQAQRAFIRKTIPQLAKAGPRDVVVEKTVSNTLRIPYAAKAFPEARFVHLIRDGRDVAESAMRQWQAPPDWSALFEKLRGMPLANLGYVAWFAKNFVSGMARGRGGGHVWGPRFAGIEDFAATHTLAETCAAQWAQSVTQASADLAHLPEGQVYEIRYEDLIADARALRTLAEALDLPEPESSVAALKARLSPPAPALWQDLPEADRAAITRICGPVLTAKGYLT